LMTMRMKSGYEMENKMVHYCDICCMKYRLPINNSLSGDSLAAGYCDLCGHSSVYVGRIVSERAKSLGLKILKPENVE